jgi:hypothetical protein
MLIRLMSGNEEAVERPRISSRDRQVQRHQLRAWLAERLGDPKADVSELAVPPTNGMSSETLLFDASWHEAGMPGFLAATTWPSPMRRSPGMLRVTLDFYTLYAALRHAIIMARIARRSVHFGEAAPPDDPDDLILHRPTLAALVAGTYWRADRA